MEMVKLEVKDESGGKQFTARDMMKDKKLRRPLLVACVLQVSTFDMSIFSLFAFLYPSPMTILNVIQVDISTQIF